VRALDPVAVLVLLLVVFDWSATAAMWRLRSAAPQNTALASRTLTSFLLSVAATLAAGLAVAELARASVAPQAMSAIVAVVFVLMSIPQVHWLWLYWKGNWQ